MVVLARLYRDAKDWTLIEERLKLTLCPRCKRVGTLLRHGYLRGFDECNPHKPKVRARRIFCSNCNLRPGCGRTSSIWVADEIKRLSLTTNGLWRFLQLIVRKRLATAIRCFECHLSDRTLQRIWNRFRLGQRNETMPTSLLPTSWAPAGFEHQPYYCCDPEVAGLPWATAGI